VPHAATATLLRQHGIQPSAQRVAVADYVLHTAGHPSADQVWERVHDAVPMCSRATVYNTLNLLVEKGLLRALVLAGRTVFDPLTGPHHHFIDDATGEILDVPWEAVRVSKVDALPGFEVREYAVVLRGRRTGRRAPRSRPSTTAKRSTR
jgi:Fur family iron response transcriptional regulator